MAGADAGGNAGGVIGAWFHYGIKIGHALFPGTSPEQAGRNAAAVIVNSGVIQTLRNRLGATVPRVSVSTSPGPTTFPAGSGRSADAAARARGAGKHYYRGKDGKYYPQPPRDWDGTREQWEAVCRKRGQVYDSLADAERGGKSKFGIAAPPAPTPQRPVPTPDQMPTTGSDILDKVAGNIPQVAALLGYLTIGKAWLDQYAPGVADKIRRNRPIEDYMRRNPTLPVLQQYPPGKYRFTGRLEPVTVTAKRMQMPQPRPAPAPARAPTQAPKRELAVLTVPQIVVPRMSAPAPGRTPAKVSAPAPGTALPPKWKTFLDPLTLAYLLPRGAQRTGSGRKLRFTTDPLTVNIPGPLTSPLGAFAGVPNTAECSCSKSPKKRGKRKARTVCYEGTYRETANGIRKLRRKEVPCK